MARSLTTNNAVGYFKHSPGDGVHYINDNAHYTEDGRFLPGDSSDRCIIANAQCLCTAFSLPSLSELWTSVYADDPMSHTDLLEIMDAALPYLNECDPKLALHQHGILSDLKAIKCKELASKIENMIRVTNQVESVLKEKGTPD